MGDLSAAQSARADAVTGGTHSEQHRTWRRWTDWCSSVGITATFLDTYEKNARVTLIGGFAHAVRSRRFSKPADRPLAASTVANTVSSLATTFCHNGRPNPSLDTDGHVGHILSSQLRAYRNLDDAPQQQKACCSCKYLDVQNSRHRRTTVLKINDIKFYKSGRLLPDNSTTTDSADIVSATFRYQKNDKRNDTIHQWASSDPALCPVKALSAVVTRIRSYRGSSDSSPLCTFEVNGRLTKITSHDMITALRNTVAAIGFDRLGFGPQEIGTHSLRSGAAMAMYLSGCPAWVIMMIGRWSGEAFLLYIRSQVDLFSIDIMERMIQVKEFRHLPTTGPGHTTNTPTPPAVIPPDHEHRIINGPALTRQAMTAPLSNPCTRISRKGLMEGLDLC